MWDSCLGLQQVCQSVPQVCLCLKKSHAPNCHFLVFLFSIVDFAWYMLLHVKDRKCSQVNLMEQHQQLQSSFKFLGILPQIPKNNFYSCWPSHQTETAFDEESIHEPDHWVGDHFAQTWWPRDEEVLKSMNVNHTRSVLVKMFLLFKLVFRSYTIDSWSIDSWPMDSHWTIIIMNSYHQIKFEDMMTASANVFFLHKPPNTQTRLFLGCGNLAKKTYHHVL